MIEIIKVLNPVTGEYTDCANIEEAKIEMCKLATSIYLQYSHNTPLIKVLIDENGFEHWSGIDNGTELPVEYLLEGVKDAKSIN